MKLKDTVPQANVADLAREVKLLGTRRAPSQACPPPHAAPVSQTGAVSFEADWLARSCLHFRANPPQAGARSGLQASRSSKASSAAVPEFFTSTKARMKGSPGPLAPLVGWRWGDRPSRRDAGVTRRA